METDTYLTLAAPSEGQYKEKGSKFLSFAFPVKDEKEILEQLSLLRKKHHDARHHCYAYRLGMDQANFRSNDDGEPNHSAGDPILGQIRSHQLTNVLIVVIRYFGGTKLGVGGLIQAYRAAAAEAIASNSIIEAVETEEMHFVFKYPDMNEVMKTIKEEDVKILSQQFDNTCQMRVRVRKGAFDRTKERLSAILSIRFPD